MGNGKSIRACWRAARTASRPRLSKRETFRPPGGDIGQRDCIEAATLHVSSTVGGGPNRPPENPGSVSSRLPKGADRDLLFEHRTRFGGRMAMGMGVTMGLQEAICGSRAHREKLAAVFFAELYMSMLLQVFKNVWQKRD